MRLSQRCIGIGSATFLLTAMAHCGEKPRVGRAINTGQSYLPAPFVDRVIPAIAPNNVETKLTVIGSHFKAGQKVQIGGVDCPGTVDSSEQMTCTFPGKPKTCGDQRLTLTIEGESPQEAWNKLRLLSRSFGFNAATDVPVGVQPVAVAAVQSTIPDQLNLFVANQGSDNVSRLGNDGAGNFGLFVDFSVGVQPVSIARNLNTTAIANQGSRDVTVLGAFNAVYPLGAQPASVAVVATASQILAIVTANPGSNNVSVLAYNSSERFDPAVHVSVGTQPVSVVAGDFNGDMKPDVAVVNQGSNSVSVLLGDGMKGFSSAVDFPAGMQPASAATGDFNSDTKLDLVVANQGSSSVSVLLGDGMGGFAAASNFPAGRQPVFVAVGDLNSDTKLDLAVVNNGDNNVSVLLGDGSGGFGAASNLPVGSQPRSLAVGDFNSDGQLDVVAANTGSNSVSVLLQACE